MHSQLQIWLHRVKHFVYCKANMSIGSQVLIGAVSIGRRIHIVKLILTSELCEQVSTCVQQRRDCIRGCVIRTTDIARSRRVHE